MEFASVKEITDHDWDQYDRTNHRGDFWKLSLLLKDKVIWQTSYPFNCHLLHEDPFYHVIENALEKLPPNIYKQHLTVRVEEELPDVPPLPNMQEITDSIIERMDVTDNELCDLLEIEAFTFKQKLQLVRAFRPVDMPRTLRYLRKYPLYFGVWLDENNIPRRPPFTLLIQDIIYFALVVYIVVMFYRIM